MFIIRQMLSVPGVDSQYDYISTRVYIAPPRDKMSIQLSITNIATVFTPKL